MSAADALRRQLAPLQARWQVLPLRDRRALALLALALAGLLAWFAVISPVLGYADGNRDDLEHARADLGWMQANANRVRRAASQGAGHLEAGQSLLSAVNASAKDAGLNLQRFEPDGEQRVRVTLENAVFTDVMRWIVELERRYGLQVEHFNADAQAPGIANIRLTLGASS